MKTQEQIIEIVRQVLHNPQVTPPAISYSITEKGHGENDDYISDYIDVGDFERYKRDLEKILIYRFTN